MSKYLFVLATIILACPLSAKETLPELKANMDRIAQKFDGTLGYSMHYRGKPDERIELKGDEIFPSASTIKTAIMCEAMHQVEQGKFTWNQNFPVQPSVEDREVGGITYDLKEGAEVTLCDWIHYMVTTSDNTAALRLRELLGQKNVNEWLTDHGFKSTMLLYGKETGERRWSYGQTTPNEMVRLFEMIVDGAAGASIPDRRDKAGSAASCDRMLRILSHQMSDMYIVSQIPPDVHAASKYGLLPTLSADVAVVFSPGGTYFLAVFVKDKKDTRFVHANEGNEAIRKLSALVWKHYNPKHPWSPPKGSDELAWDADK